MLHDHTGRDLAAAAEAIAGAARLVIGCDFDGTIAPIVGQPDQARPLPGSVAALSDLAGLPRTHVAVISGRARRDLAALLGEAPGVILIGSHGAEWGSDFADTVQPDALRTLRDLTRQVTAITKGVEGALVEKKPASVAVHVRRASRPDARRVLDEVDAGPAATPGITVIRGKEVVELSVAGADKGTAMERLRSMFEPTMIAYLGDDTTDEDAFGVLGPDDIGVKIGDGETAATVRLDDPSDTVLLLAAVLKRRRGGPRSSHR